MLQNIENILILIHIVIIMKYDITFKVLHVSNKTYKKIQSKNLKVIILNNI